MDKKVAIVYGWAEGKGHAKYLRSQLRSEGFKLVKNSAEADVIIAHSGGIFLLPKHLRAELVILVGIPYWPEKHPSRSLRDKIRLELKNLNGLRYFLRKSLLNCIYFIIRPLHHFKIWRSWKRELYPFPHNEESFIAVRNKDDTFSKQNEVTELAANKSWNVVSLDGFHDDIWLNPDKYIQLIKSKLA